MQIVQTNILFLPTAGLIVIIPSSLRLLLCSALDHVTFTGVDCTGEGQSELWISFFLYFSDHLAQIQPAAPPNQKANAAPICSPPLQPIFLVPSTINIEKSLFPSSLQQPLT